MMEAAEDLCLRTRPFFPSFLIEYMSEHPGDTLLFVGGSGVCLVWMFTRAASRYDVWKRRRDFKAHPKTSIASLESGERARVSGDIVVAVGQPLRAPFSRKPCVAYEVYVFEQNDATRAQFGLRREKVGATGIFDGATPVECEVLLSLGIEPEASLFLKTHRALRFIEHQLDLREVCSVLGYAWHKLVDAKILEAVVDHERGDYRTAPNRAQVFESVEDLAVIVTEDPRLA